MKKLILLALTALTLMACADNGVSAPSADEPSKNNNGNCYEKELSFYDVDRGKEFNAYYSEWVKPLCTEWSETNPDVCLRYNIDGTTIVKICE